MNYARVAGGRVEEVITLPEGLTIAEMFHPDVVAQMVECGPEARFGWLQDGTSFNAPPEIAVPPPAPPAPIIIPGGVLFERMTEDEAEAIDAAMAKKPIKTRGAWNAVVAGGDLREDHAVWAVLHEVVVGLYGEQRAQQLMRDAGRV